MMKKALSVILLFVLVFNMVVAGVEVKAEDNGGTSQETDNYIQLSTGVATKIDITTAGQEVYCEFVPEQSGTYKFDAESEGEYTCAWLYDSDFQDIAEGDYPDGEEICELLLKDMDYLFWSRKFWIPNATTQDLH